MVNFKLYNIIYSGLIDYYNTSIDIKKNDEMNQQCIFHKLIGIQLW